MSFRRFNFFNSSITLRLIIINTLIFIIFAILGVFFDQESLLNFFALKPEAFFSNYYIWTLLTSMFLHANFFHLFVNMFSLFFIGGLLEKIIGRKRFFWIYILSGIFAGIFFAALSHYFGYGYIGTNLFMDPNKSAVGASGALFGLLGVLAVLTPKNRICLIVGPLIALVAQVFLDKFFLDAALLTGIIINLYIIFSIFALISFNPRLVKIALPVEMSFWIMPIIAIVPLILIDLIPGIDLPIGNTAHFGGLVAGLLYGFYLSRKYPNKTKMLRRYFSR